MFRLLGSSLGGLVTTPYSCPLGEKELPRFDGCLLAPPATDSSIFFCFEDPGG